MKNKTNFILFLLLVFLSLVPRSVEILNHNYLFGFDQGRDYLAVQNIVSNHKFTLIGSEIGAGAAGFKGIFHGPFYYYFLSLPYVLLKGDPYGGMILMFLFGIATIVFSWYLGKKLFGNTIGLVFGILVAVSPFLVSQARFIWNSHPSSVFILISFFFVYKFIRDKKTKYLFFAAFFSGFIYNFELAMAIPMSLALILYSILYFKIKNIKGYMFLLFGFFVSFSPMFIFELKHNLLGTRGILDYIFNHQDTAITSKFVEMLTKDHLTSFLYNFFGTFPKLDLVPPVMIFSIVFLPLIYYFFKEKDKILKKFISYLLLLMVANLLVFFFLRNNIYNYYLIDLNLAYIIFLSYSIYSAYKKGHKILIYSLTGFLILVILSALKYNTINFKDDFQDYGGTAKIKGKIDALDYIYKDSKGEKFNLLVFSPPIYTYPYDYLVTWYGENKYKYRPYQEKKGVYYLLIEKDSSKEWSYKGWLETVIKDGKVLETKTLPSGFIIQKRIEEKNDI
ncbi:MAG: glycosyltransferase family 39 protein [Candidatus Levybacteria bacterium]|nr:glycosyltransferase family 39 protein [Candidatus Levybacteria bacterium]